MMNAVMPELKKMMNKGQAMTAHKALVCAKQALVCPLEKRGDGLNLPLGRRLSALGFSVS